jgi:hypothetical protein
MCTLEKKNMCWMFKQITGCFETKKWFEWNGCPLNARRMKTMCILSKPIINLISGCGVYAEVWGDTEQACSSS